MAVNHNQLVSASLYCGDLNPNVTEPELYELFSQVGPVASIRVLRDAMTRRSLGYAYVNFHNVVDAERALDTLNYTQVKGSPIRLMWKHRDPYMRKSGVGNIFIKNLDKTVDSRALNDTFSQFGNILSCKVAMDENGNSKGYGFVQYEIQEEADKAIETVNGNLIAGKRVFVGPFQPAVERDQTTGEKKYTNVFVKNLDESVEDAKLNEVYAKFGKISSAVVMKFPDGKSRGFGFVNFETPEEAKKAVEETNGTKAFGGEKVIYAGKAEKKAKREAELREQWRARKAEQMAKYQGVNLYIKNLEDTVDDEGLRKLFEPFGTITSAKVMLDDKTQSKGFGFVCFSAPEEATRAVTEMNGKMVGAKPIYVALHQPKEIRRVHLQQQQLQRHFANGMRPGFVAPGMPGGQPVPLFIAPPGAPVGQRAGQMFMFPQAAAMGPGRWAVPRGAPVPLGPGQVPRQQRPRRIPGQPGAPQPGMQQMPAQVSGPQGNRGFKLTGNVRNREAAAGPVAAPAAVPAPAAAPAMMVSPAALTKEQLASMLVNVPPEQQKQMLGERLYALIFPNQPSLAGKITGMLLEGLDNSELLHLIDSEEALQSKISEAIAALEAHAQQQTA